MTEGLPHSFIANGLTSLLFFAGILCKENAIILPAVLLLVEWILFQQNLKQIIFRAGIIALIALPPVIGSFFLIHNLHGPDATHIQGVWNRLEQHYFTAGLTLTEVVLTQCRTLFLYLATIIAPFWSGVQLIAAETVSRSLVDPPVTVAAVFGVIALVALSLRLVKGQPVVAFGVLFFCVTLLPESLLIPQYLFCGYRAVLPMAGILLIFGQLILHLVALSEGLAMKVVAATLVLTAITASAWMTALQAREWNPFHVWRQAYNRLPPISPNVETTPYLDILGSFGIELINAGRYEDAIQVLTRVASIDSHPNNFKKTLALVNLGLAQTKKGNIVAGLESLRRAVQSDPADAWPRYNLGVALVESGNTGEGLASLRKAAELNPRDPAARFYLGKALMQEGRTADAIERYREAARIDPGSPAIFTSLAVALEKSGDLAGAVANYRKAVELDPRSPEFHFNFAKSVARTGDIHEAIASYQKAVELNPSFGPGHANLGTLLLRSGSVADAAAHLQKALTLLPGNAELTYQYGLALRALGRNSDAGEQFKKALTIKPDHAAARKALEGPK